MVNGEKKGIKPEYCKASFMVLLGLLQRKEE
jgi:hypothetical protein